MARTPWQTEEAEKQFNDYDVSTRMAGTVTPLQMDPDKQQKAIRGQLENTPSRIMGRPKKPSENESGDDYWKRLRR